MKQWIKIFTLSLIFTFSGFYATAQSLYREYNANNVYMYIDNSMHRYWTGGPNLPNHHLVIKNVGSQTVTVRVLIKVVLRNGNGNYLEETTGEKTVTLSPGSSKRETIWMSTANKNNAYYCVEGFRVLSVSSNSPQTTSSSQSTPTTSQSSQKPPQQLSADQYKTNGKNNNMTPVFTISKGVVNPAVSYSLRNGVIVTIYHWKTIDGVKYGCTKKETSNGNYLYIRESDLTK